MARLVRITRNKPYKIEPQEKPVWVCGCGLSQTLPYCDGSHQKCAGEADGEIDVYDGNRQNVRETCADPPSLS